MVDQPDEVSERFAEALARVRPDLYHPIKYMFFIFFAGIARGIGFALGMTIILAVLVFFVTKILGSMVDFPLIGSYVQELLDVMQVYLKTGVKIR